MLSILDEPITSRQARRHSRIEQNYSSGPVPTNSPFVPALDPNNPVSAPPQLSVKKLLASYKGWNYAFINRICMQCPSVFPQVGRRRNMLAGEDAPNVTREQARMYQAAGIYLADNEQFEVVKSHRMIELLRRPTPEPDGTWTQFAYEVLMFWQLCGEVWIWKIPDAFGLPAALWVIPNDKIYPATDGRGRTTSAYDIFNEDGTILKRNVPTEQIMRGRFKSPFQKNGAYSATQAMAPWLMSADAVDTSQYTSFSTDILSDWALMLDENRYPAPDESTLDRLQMVFARRAVGLARKGFTLIPPGIKEMKDLRKAPREMEYKDSGGVLRDNIGATRGMSRWAVGISEDMNRGDTQEAEKAFWCNVGDPVNIFFGDLLTTQCAVDFDPALIVCFPTGLRNDPEQDRLDRAFAWSCGGWTPDDERVHMGKKPYGQKWSEIGYIPSSLVPLDAVNEPEPDPENDRMAEGVPDEAMLKDGNDADSPDGSADDGENAR